MSTVANYRQKEIDKVIDSVFKQFSVTNEDAQKLLRGQLLTQMKAYSPMLEYTSENKASSSNYRNDIRSFMIDLTAQLLTLNDLESDLKNLEAQSRDLFSFGNTRIAMIENQSVSSTRSGRVIYESFSEELFTGIHNNTIVKDGFLRLNSAARQPTFSVDNLKVTTLPSKSSRNSINAISNGDAYTIFGTGVGSDSYWTIVSSKHEPVIEYNGETGHYESLRGIITEIEFETSKPIKPGQISAKFSVASRIYRVFGKENAESAWEGIDDADGNLVEDLDEGLYSIVDTIKPDSNGYTKFKIVINTPTYVQEQNGRKYYRFGIYNLKVLEQKSQVNGKFISNNYTSEDHTFKCIVDSREKKPGGSIKSTVNFNLGTYSHSFPVWPGKSTGAETVIDGIVLRPSYSTSLRNYYILPFPKTAGSSLSFPNQNITSSDITEGYYVNDVVVPGTQFCMFSTLVGVTEEVLRVTYTAPSVTNYLYYIDDPNYTENEGALVLKDPNTYDEFTLGEATPKVLRCTDELASHVSSETDDVLLLRYTDANS